MLRRIISGIVEEIEESIGRSSLLEDLDMRKLPALHIKCIELVELLVNDACNYSFFSFPKILYLLSNDVFIKVEGNEEHHWNVVKALQDMFELVTTEMMLNGSRLVLKIFYPIASHL